MSEHYNALTVILEKEIHEEDAEHIINAIKCIKRVTEIKPVITDGMEMEIAKSQLRIDLFKDIRDLFYPERAKRRNEK